MERLAVLSAEHLLVRMRMLNAAMRAAVESQRGANRVLASSKDKGMLLSEAHVKELLARADKFVASGVSSPAATELDAGDAAAEQELRRQALLERALLPLDRLAGAGLTRQEQDALVACAAPELDRAYERLYAYILDDLNRRAPGVALLAELTTATPLQRAWSLHVFGAFGQLRRRRLLVATGDAANEARQELRLGPGVLDFLLNGRAAPASVFRDRAEIELPDTPIAVDGVDSEQLRALGEALTRSTVNLAGVWGDAGATGDVVRTLCVHAGVQVRRLVSGDVKCHENCPREEVRKAFLACATLATVLWVETDLLAGEAGDAALETLHEQLLVSPVRVILSGKTPWRPCEVLAARAYHEIALRPPGSQDRNAMWSAAVPSVGPDQSRRLAARYRLTSREMQAATRVAGTSAALASNGHAAPIEQFLDDACAAVTRRATMSFARMITPRRRAADLVLAPSLHKQVLEVARFQQAAPRVAEEWGFSRLDPGAGALRVLFSGDSGTGKTLAAEVIASELSAPLIKVDLARVVSKWIGETEKNLSAVFDEARSMHAVLFFDEADALFGRRGEVQRGTDRYANLEVSYLLQRLEEHDAGVVILASNLKDNIDAAFTRRFQVSLHFPRPSEELRRRLWTLAIPDVAPVANLDLDLLARIDLTGGGIVGAARTAALLAADAGGDTIEMSHIVRGLARQFKRESRLLTPADLGGFAEQAMDA